MSGQAPSDTSGKKILCVEDDEDSCEALAQLLRQPGHRVVTAYTVAEGLRLSQAGDFDLIILDNWFKESSGIKLCRQLRQFDPKTPIIFYSAAGYDTDIEEGLRAGADAYIVKPHFGQFQQAVAEMLKCGKRGR
jgi:DNA-binding response OmpR family regulator